MIIINFFYAWHKILEAYIRVSEGLSPHSNRIKMENFKCTKFSGLTD